MTPCAPDDLETHVRAHLAALAQQSREHRIRARASVDRMLAIWGHRITIGRPHWRDVQDLVEESATF